MTTPCREQIAAAVETELAAIAISGLTVERNRVDPVTTLPHLVLHEDEETATSDFAGEDGYGLVLTLEGFAGGASDAAAEAARSELRAEADKVMLALPATTTPGVAVRAVLLTEEPEELRLTSSAAGPQRSFKRSYIVEYATVENNPYIFA